MHPRRMGGRQSEAGRVEKRRGSTTITTKWVKEQETPMEKFVPTIPLRYRKDHVMFHFDDEARIGVTKREEEEMKRRKMEEEEKERKEAMRQKREQEEREQHKKREELKKWIKKEEEEKQKALGRAVLEWHKEMKRWGKAGQEKVELLEGLKKACTCLPTDEEGEWKMEGDHIDHQDEQLDESLQDSLEPATGRPPKVLHSPGSLLAYYSKEAAKHKPELFQETWEAKKVPSRVANQHQPQSQANDSVKGQSLYRKNAEILKTRRQPVVEGGRERRADQSLHSSILAWREGVERLTQGETRASHVSHLLPRARRDRAVSCQPVNFGAIR